MNSDNTITTIASENIRDLWKVLDNTPGKGPSAASNADIRFVGFVIDLFLCVESTTVRINAQRKALTARSAQQQSGTTNRGRGGGTRSKVRNWNIRDE